MLIRPPFKENMNCFTAKPFVKGESRLIRVTSIVIVVVVDIRNLSSGLAITALPILSVMVLTCNDVGARRSCVRVSVRGKVNL